MANISDQLIVEGSINAEGAVFAGNLAGGTYSTAEQNVCGLWVTTGVPSNSNGANGDVCLRSDGAAGTTVYQRRSGAWVAVDGAVTQGGTGNPVLQIANYTQAVTPVAVAANTAAEQTFTVTGLAATDTVVVNKPTAQAGLGIVGARVSATNTLAITYGNFTGSPITPTAETYRVMAVRS